LTLVRIVSLALLRLGLLVLRIFVNVLPLTRILVLELRYVRNL